MTALEMPSTIEAAERFPCLGGSCMVIVQGAAHTAPHAAARAKKRLLGWHAQFSRFDPSSELSALNRDPRPVVPVSPIMIRFVAAAMQAASMTGGLVDPTLTDEIEQAGYAEHFSSASLPLSVTLRIAPPRMPATPDPSARWRRVRIDGEAGTISRPPGMRLDCGGIAKGLFGDVLASELGGYDTFAVQLAGDLRFGSADRLIRPVQVASPFDGHVLHTFELIEGAVATSGIGKRSWLTRHGKAAHHLLDPGTGKPAFTGVLQVTALAPSGLEAEALAKAALLSGTDGAAQWLRHGGVVVYEEGAFDVIEPGGAKR